MEVGSVGLEMQARKAVTKEVAARYRRAGKKEKVRILDEFCKTTGYARKYAITVLRNYGKESVVRIDGKMVRLVGGAAKKKRHTGRPKTYDSRVFKVVRELWYLYGCMCGKRLVVAIRLSLGILEACGEIEVDTEVRQKLLRISAATIDRQLAAERRKLKLKGGSHTKHGRMLKCQIPIRTFSEWDEAKIGFVEMDLVGHEGGDARGEFGYTLTVTDVKSGWTECSAVKNRAQKWTLLALKGIRARLPFELLGIDTDNGSEFINAHMIAFCKQYAITFTRSRPYRKNDSCFVEQKNGAVVRGVVGYFRHDTDEEVELLNELYGRLRLWVNYFHPSMKLIKKVRVGSRVSRQYDGPKTPYQRILETEGLANAQEVKRRLRQEYEGLNPAELQRGITSLQEKLWRIVAGKKRQRTVIGA